MRAAVVGAAGSDWGGRRWTDSIGSKPQAAGDMSAPTSRLMLGCAWGSRPQPSEGPVLRRLTAIEGASHEIRGVRSARPAAITLRDRARCSHSRTWRAALSERAS